MDLHGFVWISMVVHGFRWISWIPGVRGSAACGIEISGYAAPSEESLLGIWRLGSFEAWKLGLEAWKLGSLLDTSMDSSIG